MALIRQTLVEYVTTPVGLRVDREAGFLAEVKVLGLQSANGRRYDPAGVRKAAGLYEAKQVNVDHGSTSKDSRSARDRFGWLEGIYVKDDGLYARKLHFLKSHPMAGPIAEAAERNPSLFALSHNAVGNSRNDGSGSVVVEEIEEVLSVDVVADGATCRSLREGKMTRTYRQIFEALAPKHAWQLAARKWFLEQPVMDQPAPDMANGGAEKSSEDAAIDAACTMLAAAIREKDFDKAREILKSFEKMLAPEEPEPAAADDGDGEPPAGEGRKGSTVPDVKKLEESFALRLKARDLASDAGVRLSKVLRTALDACTSETQVKELIEEAKQVPEPSRREPQKPKSSAPGKGQTPVREGKIAMPDTVRDGKSFLEWARS
jgi:hypothetical protein